MPLLPIKHQLHVNHIEPPAKLESNLFEVTHFFKMEFRVQGNTGGLVGINTGNDGTMAQAASADDKVLQEQRTETTAMMLVMDVH